MAEYAVAFCTGGLCDAWFVDALVRLLKADDPDVLEVIAGPVIYRNRNQLCKMYLELDEVPERLLFIDDDIVFTVEDVHRLMEHDDDIVSGVYPNQNGKMMQVGGGFLAIKRHVIEALMPYPFDPIPVEADFPSQYSGEDIAFHIRAERAGFKALVDGTIGVGHAKTQILRFSEGSDQPVHYLSDLGGTT